MRARSRARATSGLEELIQKGSNLGHGAGHFVLPLPELPICIHRGNPPPRGSGLHFCQLVEPFGFENQMDDGIGLESNDEVRHVVVRLTVVQIRNGEPEPRILDERVDSRVRVNVVRGFLLPFLRIGKSRSLRTSPKAASC